MTTRSRCIVLVDVSMRCRRPARRQGYCLFHLEAKTKQESQLFRRRLLSFVSANIHSNSDVDFRGFVFPSIEINLNEAYLSGNVSLYFSNAKFNGTKLNLSNVQFGGVTLDFTGTVFSNGANVRFESIKFAGTTINLRKTEIVEGSTLAFAGAVFEGTSMVYGVKTHVADKSTLSFEESTFTGTSQLYFNEAGFFDGANLDMREITLEEQAKAVFPYTIFDEHSRIDCINATLNDTCEVDFPDTDLGASSFAWTKLVGLARLTIGRSDQPVDLSRVSFLHADVRRIEFGNVVWGTRPRGSVVDESVLTKMPFQSYVHVAELYRALRQNYESQLRFNEASDFFVREMELIRTKPRYWGELLGEKPKSIRKAAGQSLRRTISWIRSYISVAAIYYLIAEYGESYRRAFYWSLASVLVFYPTLRFLRDGAPNSLPAFSAEYLHSVESGLRLFFQVFALPNLDAVDIAFRLWSALLLAIFFIAVRRKFERKS